MSVIDFGQRRRRAEVDAHDLTFVAPKCPSTIECPACKRTIPILDDAREVLPEDDHHEIDYARCAMQGLIDAYVVRCHERLQEAADRGFDTWEDYRGER